MPSPRRRPNPARITYPFAHRAPGHIPDPWRYRTRAEALRETFNGNPGRKTDHYYQPAPWGLETLGYEANRSYSRGTSGDSWQPAGTPSRHPYLTIVWLDDHDMAHSDSWHARISVIVPPQQPDLEAAIRQSGHLNYPPLGNYPHWVNVRTGQPLLNHFDRDIDCAPGALTYTTVIRSESQFRTVISTLDLGLRTDPDQYVLAAALLP